jgi:hypothetical protein
MDAKGRGNPRLGDKGEKPFARSGERVSRTTVTHGGFDSRSSLSYGETFSPSYIPRAD